MKSTRHSSRTLALGALTVLSLAAWATAQNYDLSWHTVDGGGHMFSTGGTFSLGGTIGQPDAGMMTGGQFQLTGGFWAGNASVCTCPGDMNGDGMRNGGDVQQFVNCVLVGGSCSCADMNGVGGIEVGDVPAFVQQLLAVQTCP